MKKTKVFIGGPIQYALQHSHFNIAVRKILEKVLSEVEAAGFQVFSAHRYERYGELDMAGMETEVCRRDYNWMRNCDIFIAVLPALDDQSVPVRTDGTCVELGWASALGKKMIIIRSPSVQYSHLVEGLGAINDALLIVDIDEVANGGISIAALIDNMLNYQVTI